MKKLLIFAILSLSNSLFSADLGEQLVSAAENGDLNAVKFYLDSGVNPDSKNKNGETPLIYAAYKGHTEIVNLLLKAANPNIQNKNGETPLIYAAAKGYTNVVNLLLQASTNPNIQNNSGNTALTLAAYNAYGGQPEVVRLLIKAGANPNVQNNNGDTALTLAAYRGHTEIVNLLLQAGADPNSALSRIINFIAHDHHSTDILKPLFKAGVTPTARVPVLVTEDLQEYGGIEEYYVDIEGYGEYKKLWESINLICSHSQLIADTKGASIIYPRSSLLKAERFTKNIILNFPLDSIEFNAILNILIRKIKYEGINSNSRRILLTVLRRIAQDFVLSQLLPQEISLPMLLSANFPYTDFNFVITMKDGTTQKSLIDLIEEDIDILLSKLRSYNAKLRGY